MDLKRVCKALLFPHIAIVIILLPISAAFLAYSMIFFGSESPVSIVSYVLAAYTLTVLCLKVPYLIKKFKGFKRSNKYYLRWKSDDRLRINVSLFGSLIWNFAYATFQLWLGIYHNRKR